MEQTDWLLFCIDFAGPPSSRCVVEIAAQKMRGWERVSPPFYHQIKPRGELSEDRSVLFGHSFETLERDGAAPDRVYRELSAYAGKSFWVAYELETSWELLETDWQSFGVAVLAKPGFCAGTLVRKVLDPLPPNHCKIETLRQFYQLPERGALSSLSQLESLVDLLLNVIRPLTDTKGLRTWEQLTGFVTEPWYPTRLPFGKFKGRLFQDALQDTELAKWLEWLSASSNSESAAMGAWYIGRLRLLSDELKQPGAPPALSVVVGETVFAPDQDGTSQLTQYVDAALQELRRQVEKKRARLAKLQAAYTIDKRAVEVAQNILFRILSPHFRQRDKLRLRIHYRRRFLEKLLKGGEEEAQDVARESQKAAAQKDAEYERAASSLKEHATLTSDEAEELKRLWKKLVSLFHPDRFVSEPKKQEAYAELTREINDARDRGDVQRLREIAKDADAFIARMGWDTSGTATGKEAVELRKLLGSLEAMILAVLDALESLRQDPAYELHQMNEKHPGFIESTAREQAKDVDAEIEEMEEEAGSLLEQITELTGEHFQNI